jgi:Ca2+/Na+ antiporter
MLLTIPWFLVVIAGRVNLDNGVPRYIQPKLVPHDNFSLLGTGVEVNDDVRNAAVVVMLSSLSYLLIEIPAFDYRSDVDDEIAKKEYPFAVATFCCCITILLSYTLFSYFTAKNEEKVLVDIDEVITTAIKKKYFPLDVAIIGILNDRTTHALHSEKTPTTDTESTALLDQSPRRSPKSKKNKFADETGQMNRIEAILKTIFEESSGGEESVSADMVVMIMDNHGETMSLDQVREFTRKKNLTGSDMITFQEFFQMCVDFIQDKIAHSLMSEAEAIETYETLKEDIFADDESEAMPDDLESLSFDEQQFALKFRAAWMMTLGTGLIVLFSDPIVDCFSEIADRIGISSFYVAFVLAPLASNASELVASYNYALRKTPKSIGISLSTLMGATVMNNTVVLGVFMLTVFTQHLYYEFFAETLVIVIIEWIVALYVYKGVHSVADAFAIISLYPLSLVMVSCLYLLGWG